MKTKSLKIYSSKDVMPKHDEIVLMFGIGVYGFGYDSQEIGFATIKYEWLEYDPEGKYPTGCSFSYNKGKKPNENCKIIYIDGYTGNEIVDDFLYAKSKDVDKLYGGKWGEFRP